MIQIKNAQWNWKECIACFSKNDVKQFSTTSIYLCVDCRKALKDKIEREINGKEEK